MKFVRRQVAILLIASFLIFVVNFGVVIALATHGHALEFVVEHGVDHLLLIHDPHASHSAENQISGVEEDNHEFHMPGLTAVVKKKLQQLSFQPSILSNLQWHISPVVTCTQTDYRDFTAHSRGAPLTILRI